MVLCVEGGGWGGGDNSKKHEYILLCQCHAAALLQRAADLCMGVYLQK